MAQDKDRSPQNLPPEEQADTPPRAPETPAPGASLTDTPGSAPADTTSPATGETTGSAEDEAMARRLERLGGEPAPAISPEEFARLQQAGQIHIDSRGRVRTTRREETEAGMSLRKRRAWYTLHGR